MKLFLLAILVAYTSSCKVVPDRANGERLERDAFPSQVVLEVFFSYENKQFCTGNLISAQFILTSASCTFGAMFVNAHLAAFDLTNVFEASRTIFRTETILVKPGYFATTNENNIALIKLTNPLVLTDKLYNVATLPLASNNHVGNLADGATIGWGTAFESFKQQITGKILSKENCELAFPQIPKTNSGQFCVQRPNINDINCVGGLGSSFFVENTLIGLQSLVAAGSCETGAASLFTDITQHLEWINNEIVIIV